MLKTFYLTEGEVKAVGVGAKVGEREAERAASFHALDGLCDEGHFHGLGLVALLAEARRGAVHARRLGVVGVFKRVHAHQADLVLGPVRDHEFGRHGELVRGLVAAQKGESLQLVGGLARGVVAHALVGERDGVVLRAHGAAGEGKRGAYGEALGRQGHIGSDGGEVRGASGHLGGNHVVRVLHLEREGGLAARTGHVDPHGKARHRELREGSLEYRPLLHRVVELVDGEAARVLPLGVD